MNPYSKTWELLGTSQSWEVLNYLFQPYWGINDNTCIYLRYKTRHFTPFFLKQVLNYL